MNFAFILNPASGTKRDLSFFAKLIDQFSHEHKLECALWKTEKPGHGRILAEEALKKGFQCVVAIGGDGTINEIAKGLLYTQVPLGIIPKGSANGFAREFGIPLDPRKACAALLQSKTLSIDVGRINEDLFFGVAGVGFDARVSYAYNRSRKEGRRGKILYFALGIKEYFSYIPSAITLRFDHEEHHFSPFLIAIANSKKYGIGAVISPKAVVNDGRLNLSIVHRAPFYQYLRHFPKLFTGTLDRAPFFENILVKEAAITLMKEMPFHIDGEFRFGGKKLLIKIEPGSLKVKVPWGYHP